MDNDNKLIRILKKAVKKVKFKLDYRGYSILDAASGNETIRKTIEAGANAITYTPPANGDTMSNLMDKYRSE